MISVSIDRQINRIVIITDDPSVKCLLEFSRKVTKYQPWTKSWRTFEQIDKLYDNPRGGVPKRGLYTFHLGFGWAAYIVNVFKSILSKPDYESILRIIYADSFRTIPFQGLRDYQNQDVLHILKYKRAILQCTTGYGKQNLLLT